MNRALFLFWCLSLSVACAGEDSLRPGFWRLADETRQGSLTVLRTPQGLDLRLTIKGEGGRIDLLETVAAEGPWVLSPGGISGALGADTGHRFRLGSDGRLSWQGPGVSGVFAWESEAIELVVVHTNDVHGQIVPTAEGQGGYAALAAFVRAERASAAASGRGFLLLDAGDAWHGTPEGNFSEGRLLIDLMNDLGYQAMAIGNHEFDHGLETVVALERRAAFPWLACNLASETGGRLDWARPAARFQVAGLRVDVVGATTARGKEIVQPPAKTRGVEFLPEVAAVAEAVAASRADGAQVVLLLSHCGRWLDLEIAREVPGLAAVVGGHDHQRLRMRERERGVTIVQAGDRARVAGRLVLILEPKSGRTLEAVSELVTLSEAEHGVDPAVKRFLAQHAEALPSDLDHPLGELTNDGDRTALGQWLCDLMRARSQTQVALINGSAVRGRLEPGALTKRRLYRVSPFGDDVVTCQLTGADLLAALEHRGGNKLLVSGLTVTFDPARDEGDRVVEVWVGERALDLEATYSVATTQYLSYGGSGFGSLVASKRQTVGVTLYELSEAAARGQEVTLPAEPRIELVEPVETGGE